MPYAYSPPRGFAVGVAFVGAYTPPRGFSVAIPFAPPGDLPVANDDSYSTGKHMPLHVVAPGVLFNDLDPAGLGLTAHLLVGPANGTLSLDADGGFSYTPDVAFLGVDTWTYYAQDGNGLTTEPATVSIAVDNLPVQRYVQISAGLPWSRTPAVMRSVGSGFALAAPVRRSVGQAWSQAAPVARAIGVAWKRSDRVRKSTGLPWSPAPPLHSRSIGIPIDKAPRVTAEAALPWTAPPVLQHTAALPWSAPPRQHVSAGLPWTRPPSLAHSAQLPFSHPPLRERRWLLPWQHAPAVQWHVRGNGVTPPDPDPPPAQYRPPRGFAIGVNFACPQLQFRGFSVPVPIGPAACYFAWPKPRTYIVLNTATVIATATAHVVEVTAIDITSSIDDLHHAFSIALADPADLAWLTPTEAGPIEIEININGHLHTGIVESWSTEHQFPGKRVSVSGRALSALLDAPYAPLRAYVETAERLAVQLVDQELALTGFTADYNTIDWTVPAGAWHYDALSPAAALRAVAAASGAVARAHPWDKVIEIQPRYPTSPWEWAVTAADKTILDDYVPRLVARDSTSGAPVYELDIPLWPSSDASKPGLLRPSQLVEFAALDGWKAQVSAVRISASLQSSGNGASALVVWQSITLEAPPAAPRYDYVLVSGEQAGVSDPIIRDGTDGTSRLPQITDALITEHTVARERGRNAIAGGGDGRASSNLWGQLVGLLPAGRYIKGNVTSLNSDGSYTVATSDGATIRARPLPGDVWTPPAGVFVQDGRIVDSAPSLPGITQFV